MPNIMRIGGSNSDISSEPIECTATPHGANKTEIVNVLKDGVLDERVVSVQSQIYYASTTTTTGYRTANLELITNGNNKYYSISPTRYSVRTDHYDYGPDGSYKSGWDFNCNAIGYMFFNFTNMSEINNPKKIKYRITYATAPCTNNPNSITIGNNNGGSVYSLDVVNTNGIFETQILEENIYYNTYKYQSFYARLTKDESIFSTSSSHSYPTDQVDATYTLNVSEYVVEIESFNEDATEIKGISKLAKGCSYAFSLEKDALTTKVLVNGNIYDIGYFLSAGRNVLYFDGVNFTRYVSPLLRGFAISKSEMMQGITPSGTTTNQSYTFSGFDETRTCIFIRHTTVESYNCYFSNLSHSWDGDNVTITFAGTPRNTIEILVVEFENAKSVSYEIIQEGTYATEIGLNEFNAELSTLKLGNLTLSTSTRTRSNYVTVDNGVLKTVNSTYGTALTKYRNYMWTIQF